MSQEALRRAAFFAACLALAAGFLAAPRAVSAHAKLLRSEPRPKSKLTRQPGAVELWFSDELQAGFNTVEVRDRQGNRFESGGVALEEGGKKLRVGLRDLPAGSYTVVWKALSTDEHTLKGRFTFTVEAPAAPAVGELPVPQPTPPVAARQEGTPAAPMAQGDADPEEVAGEEASAVTAADSLVRWLGYLSMMALAGGFTVWLFVLCPALRSHRDEGGTHEDTRRAAGAASRRSLGIFRLSVAALILSLLAALVFQSAAVHGVGFGDALAPPRLAGVIAGTGYGKSWLVQAAGAAALLVVVLLLGRKEHDPTRGRKGLWAAGLVASGLLLLGPSLTGHAAVAAKDYPLAALSDWLHLLTGAFWVGGLFHLALGLPPALSTLPRGLRADTLGRVIPLFTKVAVPAVALVLLAGLYNTWLQLGAWGALWGTPYGRTLLVKLLLVLAMLALGGVNSFHFGRRIKSLAGREGKTSGDDAGRGFARSVRLEAALGVLVLLVTAFLVFTTPGSKQAATTQLRESTPAAADYR